LGEYGEIVFSSSEADVIVESGEVGCEHGGRDFSAIRAMTDEGVGETGSFEWLMSALFLAVEVQGGTYNHHLDSTASAGSSRLIFIRPPIVGKTLKGKLGGSIFRHVVVKCSG
jgi:hypothetical protein